MIKTLEGKIETLKNEIKEHEDILYDKRLDLEEAERELKAFSLQERTKNIQIGDSIFFETEDGDTIETMLISDSKDNLDLVILTDCDDMFIRGRKLNKSFFYIDSLIENVENYYNVKFLDDWNE